MKRLRGSRSVSVPVLFSRNFEFASACLQKFFWSEISAENLEKKRGNGGGKKKPFVLLIIESKDEKEKRRREEEKREKRERRMREERSAEVCLRRFEYEKEKRVSEDS